jgi:hypothetical protein
MGRAVAQLGFDRWSGPICDQHPDAHHPGRRTPEVGARRAVLAPSLTVRD